MKGPISVEDLRAMVRLDAETGRLFWLRRDRRFFPDDRSCKSWNAQNPGREAFAARSGNGYRHGCLLGEKMTAHVIAFALHYGNWPIHTVDHINGDRSDNRPDNLRDVTHLTNMRNQPLSKASTTGCTGVHFSAQRKKYEAHITVDSKTKHLGRFLTFDEAAAARKAAEREFGFHQNHGRVRHAAHHA